MNKNTAIIIQADEMFVGKQIIFRGVDLMFKDQHRYRELYLM